MTTPTTKKKVTKKKTTARKKTPVKKEEQKPDPVVKDEPMENEEITLEHFRAWLQGVEDMQEEDWVPNAMQWKRIRHKIDCILETKAAPAPVAPAPAARVSQPPVAYQQPAAGSGLDVATRPVPQPKFNQGTPPGLPVVEGKIKTPDVDSSDGSYNSTFA